MKFLTKTTNLEALPFCPCKMATFCWSNLYSPLFQRLSPSCLSDLSAFCAFQVIKKSYAVLQKVFGVEDI